MLNLGDVTGSILGFTNKWKGEDLLATVKLELVLSDADAKDCLKQLGLEHLSLWGPNHLPWNEGVEAYKLRRPLHDIVVEFAIDGLQESTPVLSLSQAVFEKIELLAEQGDTLIIEGKLKDCVIVPDSLAKLAELSSHDQLKINIHEGQGTLEL